MHLEKNLQKLKSKDPKAAAQESHAIIAKEYNEALGSLSKETDPTKRKQLMTQLKDTREELKKVGVDVPAPGESVKPQPTQEDLAFLKANPSQQKAFDRRFK